jgi:hypothetical protein
MSKPKIDVKVYKIDWDEKTVVVVTVPISMCDKDAHDILDKIAQKPSAIVVREGIKIEWHFKDEEAT